VPDVLTRRDDPVRAGMAIPDGPWEPRLVWANRTSLIERSCSDLRREMSLSQVGMRPVAP
jgi:hypothetical protein